MKYFRINDTNTVIAKSKESALEKFKDVLGIKISESYTDKQFEDEFDIDVKEESIDTAQVYDGTLEEGADLITVAEYIKRYPELESPHFSSEI